MAVSVIVPPPAARKGCGRVADAHPPGPPETPRRLARDADAGVRGGRSRFSRGNGPVATEPVGPSTRGATPDAPAGFGPGSLSLSLPSPPPTPPPPPPPPSRPPGTSERHPRSPARDSPRRPSEPKSGTFAARRRPGHRRQRPRAPRGVPLAGRGRSSPTGGKPARRAGTPPPPPRDGPSPSPDAAVGPGTVGRPGAAFALPGRQASPSADLALDEEPPAVASRSGARRENGVLAAVIVTVRVPDPGRSRSGLRAASRVRPGPILPRPSSAPIFRAHLPRSSALIRGTRP